MTDGNNIHQIQPSFIEYLQSGWYNPILTLDNLGCIRQIILRFY